MNWTRHLFILLPLWATKAPNNPAKFLSRKQPSKTAPTQRTLRFLPKAMSSSHPTLVQAEHLLTPRWPHDFASEMVSHMFADDTDALEHLFKTTSDEVIIDAIGNIDRFLTDHFNDLCSNTDFVHKERIVCLMLKYLANNEDNLLALGLYGNEYLARRLNNKV